MELENILDFKATAELNERLKEYGIPKTFPEGTPLLNENAYIKSILMIESGSVKVMRTDEEGREILLYYLNSGESCIMSFLGGLHQDTSKVKVIAEEESEILFIPVEKIRSLIKEYPEWLDYIFRLYHKRFEELLEVINAVAFKKMDERLLSLIKKKDELTGNKSLNVTHEQL